MRTQRTVNYYQHSHRPFVLALRKLRERLKGRKENRMEKKHEDGKKP